MINSSVKTKKEGLNEEQAGVKEAVMKQLDLHIFGRAA